VVAPLLEDLTPPELDGLVVVVVVGVVGVRLAVLVVMVVKMVETPVV
jgi:hypothetical protein